MLTRVHLFISGRVQGVLFRANTYDYAKSLNLTGWVRNLLDDRVEIVVEGESEDIDELIKFIKSGPGASTVTNIQIIREPPKMEFKDFKVIH